MTSGDLVGKFIRVHPQHIEAWQRVVEQGSSVKRTETVSSFSELVRRSIDEYLAKRGLLGGWRA